MRSEERLSPKRFWLVKESDRTRHGIRSRTNPARSRQRVILVRSEAQWRSPASWCPEKSKQLAFNDLIGRHFRSHRVAKPEIIVALAPNLLCAEGSPCTAALW